MSAVLPVALLFGVVGLAALLLLFILFRHLSPHLGDIEAIRERISREPVSIVSIRRLHAVWRLHYRRPAWPLSRFARFYCVECAAKGGSPKELIAAIDPWRPERGVQIL